MTTPGRRPSALRFAALMAFALFLPTVGAAVYFLLLDGRAWAGAAYFTSKAIQFLLPLFFFPAVLRPYARPRAPLAASLLWGAILGFAMSGGLFLVYAGVLHGKPAAAPVADAVGTKMSDFQVTEPLPFLAMSMFLSLLHSGLEEYYWRWFVFGSLRQRFADRRGGLLLATGLSSLGFMSHHVLVLWAFLASGPLSGLVVPASLGIAAGGAAWALLYHWRGRLTAAWLSHAIADVAVMSVGYVLIWGLP